MLNKLIQNIIYIPLLAFLLYLMLNVPVVIYLADNTNPLAIALLVITFEVFLAGIIWMIVKIIDILKYLHYYWKNPCDFCEDSITYIGELEEGINNYLESKKKNMQYKIVKIKFKKFRENKNDNK